MGESKEQSITKLRIISYIYLSMSVGFLVRIICLDYGVLLNPDHPDFTMTAMLLPFCLILTILSSYQFCFIHLDLLKLERGESGEG